MNAIAALVLAVVVRAHPVVTLRALQNGDRACYVVVADAQGAERAMEGAFELCAGGSQDATSLIGTWITYTTHRAKVLAASCEGRFDCGKTDDVDLVITILPATR